VDAFTEQADGGTYLHAAVATGLWLAVGVFLDVYLIVTGKKRLISDVFRTRFGKTVLAVFCLHIIDRLGRADPFKMAGSLIATKYVVVEPGVVVKELTEITPDR
jgi:hypothetical protein